LEGETEREIVAAQNGVATKCHTTKILQTETANADCQHFDETVEHIILACQYWQ
jgi:hypothetical protein